MTLKNVYLKNKLCKEYERQLPIYEDLAYEMKHYISNLVEEHNIKVKSITSRAKKVDSLERKIKNKNYKYKSLDDITDLSGVRIITYYSDDVYKVEDIIKKYFNVDIKNSIDKAKSLEYDRFGYLSLHYVVTIKKDLYNQNRYKRFKDIKFEIQIRSILQDAWAEIEHDLGYKNEKGVPLQIKRDFSRLAGLLELADKEFQSIRDSIENYEDIMISKVKELKETVIVDDISVKSYVKYNEKYREILSKLAQEVEVREMHPDLDMSLYLMSTGITTLNEVDYLIKENRVFLLNMVKYERIDTYGYVGEGDLLLYVCYAKMLKSHNAEEKLIKFWDDHGYTTDKNITYEHKLSWIEDMRGYMRDSI